MCPFAVGGKPADVIEKSNGFPSGMHFNLNIHGRDFAAGETCTHEPGGNSVFIDLYGMSTIEYLSDRKSGVTKLTAVDPCAADDGRVSVEVPREILVFDDVTGLYVPVPVDGFYVYGRILAKPQNGKNDPDERSNIVFSPNMVTDISDYDEETLLPIGLITWDATYFAGAEAFYRFDDPDAKGRGKSKARDMTHLFEFSGWVVDASLDTHNEVGDAVPDGKITIEDVPLADYGEALPGVNRDYNNDGSEDDLDIAAWLGDQGDLATYYEYEWVFNIADIVTTEGEITNDGTKLFQTRFYPYFAE
jgi:hypothetical protein